MCIIHKGFIGIRVVSPASILLDKLIGLKPEIPYEIIHSTLHFILPNIKLWRHDVIYLIKEFLRIYFDPYWKLRGIDWGVKRFVRDDYKRTSKPKITPEAFTPPKEMSWYPA